MVHVGRHARRWGAYLALGVAFSLSAEAIAYADNPKPNTQATEPVGNQSETGTNAAKPPSQDDQGGAQSGNQAAQIQPLTIFDHARRWLWRLGRDPIAVFTLLLFVIGGIQFELGRKTARRQLRAYVRLSQTSSIPSTRPITVEFDAQLRNDGLTPAFEVSHRMGIELITYPIPTEIYLPEPEKTPIAANRSLSERYL